MEKLQLDWDEHDVMRIFVCVGDDLFEIRQERLLSDEFALENIEDANAAERVVKGVDFEEAGHVLFDVAHKLGIVDSFCF